MTDTDIKELVRELNFQAGTWDDNPTVTGKEIAARYRKAASVLTSLSEQVERLTWELRIKTSDNGKCGTSEPRAALGKDTQEKCPHEWRVYGDFELGGGREEVICTKCNCHGERTLETGEVYWPAT